MDSKHSKEILPWKIYDAPLSVSIVWLLQKSGRLKQEMLDIKIQIQICWRNSPKETKSSFSSWILFFISTRTIFYSSYLGSNIQNIDTTDTPSSSWVGIMLIPDFALILLNTIRWSIPIHTHSWLIVYIVTLPAGLIIFPVFSCYDCQFQCRSLESW